MQENIKLDAIDKKLFYLLSLDSRIPQTKLAKQLKISKERLHYKINRLKLHLIDPAIVLNYHALKIDSYIILLKNLEPKDLEKIKQEAPAFAIIQSFGKYNYILYILTRDVKEFTQEFLPNSHFEIYPLTAGYPDNYNPYNLNVKHPEPIKQDKPITLDKKDYKLLHALSLDPIASTLKLHEQTTLDPKTIKSRIQKMLDANIIQKFRFSANVLKMGVTAYFLKIETTPSQKEKILSNLRTNNYSGFIYETHTGFFMWYMPPTHTELFQFTQTLQTLDPTIQIDTMQTAEIIKIQAVPKRVQQILKEKATQTK